MTVPSKSTKSSGKEKKPRPKKSAATSKPSALSAEFVVDSDDEDNAQPTATPSLPTKLAPVSKEVKKAVSSSQTKAPKPSIGIIGQAAYNGLHIPPATPSKTVSATPKTNSTKSTDVKPPNKVGEKPKSSAKLANDSNANRTESQPHSQSKTKNVATSSQAKKESSDEDEDDSSSAPKAGNKEKSQAEPSERINSSQIPPKLESKSQPKDVAPVSNPEEESSGEEDSDSSSTKSSSESIQPPKMYSSATQPAQLPNPDEGWSDEDDDDDQEDDEAGWKGKIKSAKKVSEEGEESEYEYELHSENGVNKATSDLKGDTIELDPGAKELLEKLKDSALAGKEIWEFSVPRGVPLDQIKELTMDDIESGRPVLKHQGVEYCFHYGTKPTDDYIRILMPNERTNTYRPLKTPILKRLDLQAMKPNPAVPVGLTKDTTIDASESNTVSRSKKGPPIPAQFQGLKPRWSAFGGKGSSPSPSVSTHPDEAEKAPAAFKVPIGADQVAKKRKREVKEVQADAPAESSTPKKKKQKKSKQMDQDSQMELSKTTALANSQEVGAEQMEIDEPSESQVKKKGKKQKQKHQDDSSQVQGSQLSSQPKSSSVQDISGEKIEAEIKQPSPIAKEKKTKKHKKKESSSQQVEDQPDHIPSEEPAAIVPPKYSSQILEDGKPQSSQTEKEKKSKKHQAESSQQIDEEPRPVSSENLAQNSQKIEGEDASSSQVGKEKKSKKHKKEKSSLRVNDNSQPIPSGDPSLPPVVHSSKSVVADEEPIASKPEEKEAEEHSKQEESTSQLALPEETPSITVAPDVQSSQTIRAERIQESFQKKDKKAAKKQRRKERSSQATEDTSAASQTVPLPTNSKVEPPINDLISSQTKEPEQEKPAKAKKSKKMKVEASSEANEKSSQGGESSQQAGETVASETSKKRKIESVDDEPSQKQDGPEEESRKDEARPKKKHKKSKDAS